MINVPKTLCKCANEPAKPTLLVMPVVNDCEENDCNIIPSIELIPIVNSLCPCPAPPEIVINYNPAPRKRKVIKTCFTEFLRNVATNKFCDIAPSCKIS